MDPSLIVAGAMSLLAPFLQKAGEKVAETIGEKLTNAALEESFWQKVKGLFTKEEEQQAIQAIESKSIATEEEVKMIENKLKQEVMNNPQFAAEIQSNLNISSTNMFVAEQLLKSLKEDKIKLAMLMEDRRLAGVGNEDQYELEIQRIRRRMGKDEQDFRRLLNNK